MNVLYRIVRKNDIVTHAMEKTTIEIKGRKDVIEEILKTIIESNKFRLS